MNFRQVDARADVANVVFRRIEHLLATKKTPVFALPAGSTPLPLYERLVDATLHSKLPLGRARFFALDEWWSESVPATATFRRFLLEYLLIPAGIPEDRLASLPTTGDAGATATAYEEAISRAGGIDLAILGIGGNGHVAFNEPGTPLDSLTGLRELTEKTRRANAYLFTGESTVPTHGITVGIGTIMAAQTIVVMALGQGKASIVKQLRDSPVTKDLPASALKRHPAVEVIVDRLAGELL